jgi:hypothetical protein
MTDLEKVADAIIKELQRQGLSPYDFNDDSRRVSVDGIVNLLEVARVAIEAAAG